jgi:predicted HicB family RNase H-like nuclease
MSNGQSKLKAELLAQNVALQESVRALTGTVKRQQEQITALTRNLKEAISRYNAKSQETNEPPRKRESCTILKALKPAFKARTSGKARKFNRVPVPHNRQSSHYI